jgi:hypothetical protein
MCQSLGTPVGVMDDKVVVTYGRKDSRIALVVSTTLRVKEGGCCELLFENGNCESGVAVETGMDVVNQEDVWEIVLFEDGACVDSTPHGGHEDDKSKVGIITPGMSFDILPNSFCSSSLQGSP